MLGDESEPSFDLIEPGRIGGGVMDMEAGPDHQRESHLGALVGRVVVDDHTHAEVCRDGLLGEVVRSDLFLIVTAYGPTLIPTSNPIVRENVNIA